MITADYCNTYMIRAGSQIVSGTQDVLWHTLIIAGLKSTCAVTWQGELDELEREEFFRLKKVQAKKKRDAQDKDAAVIEVRLLLVCTLGLPPCHVSMPQSLERSAHHGAGLPSKSVYKSHLTFFPSKQAMVSILVKPCLAFPSEQLVLCPSCKVLCCWVCIAHLAQRTHTHGAIPELLCRGKPCFHVPADMLGCIWHGKMCLKPCYCLQSNLKAASSLSDASNNVLKTDDQDEDIVFWFVITKNFVGVTSLYVWLLICMLYAIMAVCNMVVQHMWHCMCQQSNNAADSLLPLVISWHF